MGLLKNFITNRIDKSMVKYQDKVLLDTLGSVKGSVYYNLGELYLLLKYQHSLDLVSVYNTKDDIEITSTIIQLHSIQHATKNKDLHLVIRLWVCILRSVLCVKLKPKLTKYLKDIVDLELAMVLINNQGLEFSNDIDKCYYLLYNLDK